MKNYFVRGHSLLLEETQLFITIIFEVPVDKNYYVLRTNNISTC